jgi:hypothetical protein
MDTRSLKDLLSYDPTTGLFTWKKSNSTKPVVGTIAGTRHPHGYIRINIKRKMYYAHRLAWLYVHGAFPTHEIDHVDRDPANNRIDNLRLATHPQNASNAPKRRTNRSGLKGVCHVRGRWIATISSNGRQMHIGMFDTAAEAHSAYLAAAKKYHREFMHV